MASVHILGVGLTKFGRHPDRSVESLTAEAIVAACKDADIEWKRVV